MKLPDLCIFDMDGLLFDSERLFMKKKELVLREYGYQQKKEDYELTLGTTGETLKNILYQIYGSDYPADEISQKTRELVDQHNTLYGPSLKPGIPELLTYLQQKQIPCCVATSTDSTTAKRYLTQGHILHYFSYVIGGDAVRISKPDPEIFLKACYHYKIKPEHALVFEDSENGILAAHSGHIPVICIPDLKFPDKEKADLTTAVVTSAFDIISLFEKP